MVDESGKVINLRNTLLTDLMESLSSKEASSDEAKAELKRLVQDHIRLIMPVCKEIINGVFAENSPESSHVARIRHESALRAIKDSIEEQGRTRRSGNAGKLESDILETRVKSFLVKHGITIPEKKLPILLIQMETDAWDHAEEAILRKKLAERGVQPDRINDLYPTTPWPKALPWAEIVLPEPANNVGRSR